MLLLSPMTRGTGGNLSSSQKASRPLFTHVPWLGAFLLSPKPSFSVHFPHWTLLRQNLEFPALLSPFSLPRTHGDISYQSQFTAPGRGPPE